MREAEQKENKPNLVEYLNIILEEIADIEHTLKATIGYAGALDPNYRLEQGKLHSLVSVATDMSYILGIPIERDFYIYSKEDMGYITDNSGYESEEESG